MNTRVSRFFVLFFIFSLVFASAGAYVYARELPGLWGCTFTPIPVLPPYHYVPVDVTGSRVCFYYFEVAQKSTDPAAVRNGWINCNHVCEEDNLNATQQLALTKSSYADMKSETMSYNNFGTALAKLLALPPVNQSARVISQINELTSSMNKYSLMIMSSTNSFVMASQHANAAITQVTMDNCSNLPKSNPITFPVSQTIKLNGGWFGSKEDVNVGHACDAGFKHQSCTVTKNSGGGDCHPNNGAGWVGGPTDCTCSVHFGARSGGSIDCTVTITEGN